MSQIWKPSHHWEAAAKSTVVNRRLHSLIDDECLFHEDSPLPKRALPTPTAKAGLCRAELHLVIDDRLGVGLAGSVNRERQRLAVRRDFKFRVVHYLALHLVGDFERVCVYTLA